MKATDRHKARVAEMVSEPMEGEHLLDISDEVSTDYAPTADELAGAAADVAGATSDNVLKYGSAAGGMLSEFAAGKLKEKEDEEAKKKLESSEGFLANKEATEAGKKAAMAKADALTEADPLGPKHKAAAELAVQAQAAREKASYFQQQSYAAGAPGQMQPGASGQYPQSYAPQAPSIFTTKNMLIAGGAVIGVGLLALLLRRK